MTLTLGWDANPEPDVLGYVVYYGGASLDYTDSLIVFEPSAALAGLQEGGTYFFAVAAWDQWGHQSPLSKEFQYTIPRSRVQLRISHGPDDNTVRVIFDPLPGRAHELQVSSDLVSWATLSSIPPTFGPRWIEWVDYLDAPPRASRRRFYRVIVK